MTKYNIGIQILCFIPEKADTYMHKSMHNHRVQFPHLAS